MKLFYILLIACGLAACGDDGEGIDSDEEARRAYLGLDESLGKSLKLGFDGFKAADNANIPDQMTTGTVAGTLVIGGKVDAGASDNKTMTLSVGMVGYNDGPVVVTENDEEIEIDITYDTSDVETEQPVLSMKLQNFPNGTVTGTLTGDYNMSGDIDGVVTLMLSFTGETQDDGTGFPQRKPGTIMVTGSATTGDGLFEVVLTI